MAVCQICGTELPEGAICCPKCGTMAAAPQPDMQGMPQGAPMPGMQGMPQGAPMPEMQGMPQGAPQGAPYMDPSQQPYPPYMGPYQDPSFQYQPMPDPNDHTAEFEEADIHDNKLYAMLCYLICPLGLIVSALCAKDSAYAKFHRKESLKIFLVDLLCILCAVLPLPGLLITFVGGIFCLVLNIIAFVNVCSNKAKSAPVVGTIGFLN